MREHRLPNRRPQPRRRHRVADDAVEDVMKCPLDLAETGKHMIGLQAGFKPLAGNGEIAIPIGEEIGIESPVAGRRYMNRG